MCHAIFRLYIFGMEVIRLEHYGYNPPPPEFTLRWYAHIVRMEGFVPSFLMSLRLALMVSVLALMLGTAASLALVRYTFPGRQWINTFLISPLIFPSIITGIALLQCRRSRAYVGGRIRGRRSGTLRSPSSNTGWWLAGSLCSSPHLITTRSPRS